MPSQQKMGPGTGMCGTHPGPRPAWPRQPGREHCGEVRQETRLGRWQATAMLVLRAAFLVSGTLRDLVTTLAGDDKGGLWCFPCSWPGALVGLC